MYIRLKRSGNSGKTYEYLQIVRSLREGSRVRQKVIATLGRLDVLLETGKLERLILGLARFAPGLRVERIEETSGDE